jgi:homoserine/homoserine lactone efflux protein
MRGIPCEHIDSAQFQWISYFLTFQESVMPIEPHLYATFVLASVALILLPGPIVTLVVANALAHGTRTGVETAFGSCIGNAILATASALGLVALLGLIGDIFDVLRWVGAAYLIWLGIRAWRAEPETLDDTRPMRKRSAVMGQGILVAITNPKTIMFYAAFFPQFINPDAPAGPQLALLAVTFVILAGFLDTGYALLAGKLRVYLADAGRARIRNRLTGILLIGTGIGMALARRP